jgi:hypothetical protein
VSVGYPTERHEGEDRRRQRLNPGTTKKIGQLLSLSTSMITTASGVPSFGLKEDGSAVGPLPS